MRIIFTSPILEHPATGGPQLRIENSIKALSSLCELDIISGCRNTTGTAGEVSRDYYQRFCSEFHNLPSLIQPVSKNRYIRFIKKTIARLLRQYIRSNAKFIVNHANRRNIKIIWFGFGNISYPLMREIKSLQPNLKLVCDTDSVWSRFVLRELPHAKGIRKLRIWRNGKIKESEENSWVKTCDVTTAVSEVDAEYYRSISDEKYRIHIFSNVIDLDTYQPSPPPPSFKNPSIYLAGSFGHYHSPMDMAARWMLEEVLPILYERLPDLHFYIVGRNSDTGFGHLTGKNITVTGKVDSVLPYLYNTDVALVPLKFESGTRFKILEAGACHTPIVSTTLGAEGIPVIDGQHILIADDPQSFADAIIKILTDKNLAKNLAQNCCELVSFKYSIQSLANEAKSILEYLNHD